MKLCRGLLPINIFWLMWRSQYPLLDSILVGRNNDPFDLFVADRSRRILHRHLKQL